MPSIRRAAVIGAGIVGLATARRLQAVLPGVEVTVLDKEDRVAAHQSGHNSGVIHAGVYYTPGSLKARLCRRGAGLLREYCDAKGIVYRELGKLVVASTPAEVPALMAIRDRALANGVPDIAVLTRRELQEVEPFAEGVAAVHSPHTAVVDYIEVARALAGDVERAGGRIRLRHPVAALRRDGGTVVVQAGAEELRCELVIACAGLGTDGVARLAGAPANPRIVPFRGEYFRLVAGAAERVRGLIYPVPDPRTPFLGVHFTRGVHGGVTVGPNAVLALAREGYRWRSVDARDLGEVATWPGTWRMAARYWRTGVKEVVGSVVRAAYAREARRYLPSLRTGELVRAGAGVRAQAVDRSGALVDDFVIHRQGRVVLVRNAPSPAATSSLAIAEHVVSSALEREPVTA